MTRSTIRAVASVVVLLLILGAAGVAIVLLRDDDGGSSVQGPRATPSTTPTPEPGSSEPPKPDLEQFYAQKLEWEPCRNGFECTTLTVPVDYKDPGGETIELAVLKDNADNPGARIGSLVVNPGGPGAPGTSYAENASSAFRAALRERFDIVGFDPRGTGDSDPVDCLSDDQLDEFLAADPDPDDAAEADALETDLAEFHRGCVEHSDDLIGHVTTIEAARDMDVLRAALGESKMLYFGASYGTKLGATYADLFPDKVGRLVLDGAVDLSIDSRELSLEQAGGFETALRAYVENCVESTDSCFLGDSVEEGLERIRTFTDEVEAEPLPTDLDRELQVGNAFYGVVAPLYNRDYWPILSQALQQGFDGDGTLLLRLSDLYASREDNGGYTDNSAEAIYAINCLDDPYSIPPEDVPAQIPEFEKASPTFGRVFAWGLVGCRGIQVKSSEKPRDVRAAGAAPIVVVGTTRDPATPYQWAVHLADQLESGVLISRDGDGHTGYNSGNECVDEAVEAYLVDATVPEDGLSC
jgi:pimeloyl-ACP methyl ester carboxylesterase